MNVSTRASLQRYRLPGTNLVQENDYSSSGKCFHSAFGNALVEALNEEEKHRLFGHRPPRNLQNMVQGWLQETLEDRSIQECLEKYPGLWQDKERGIVTFQDYKTKHLKGVKSSWGGTLDIHLLAYFVNGKGIKNNIVVHSKNTCRYTVHRPFRPSTAKSSISNLMPVTHMEPHPISGELALPGPDCIILINTGNVHWSRAVLPS